MPYTVPIGIGPPNQLYFAVTPALLPPPLVQLDLRTVTGGLFNVSLDGAGSPGTPWTGFVVAGATATLLYLGYAWQGNEFGQTGRFYIEPILVVPGGTVPVYEDYLTVTNAWGKQPS